MNAVLSETSDLLDTRTSDDIYGYCRSNLRLPKNNSHNATSFRRILNACVLKQYSARQFIQNELIADHGRAVEDAGE